MSKRDPFLAIALVNVDNEKLTDDDFKEVIAEYVMELASDEITSPVTFAVRSHIRAESDGTVIREDVRKLLYTVEKPNIGELSGPGIRDRIKKYYGILDAPVQEVQQPLEEAMPLIIEGDDVPDEIADAMEETGV